MSEISSTQSSPVASSVSGATTRRAVLRTAAWTTPVIAFATAAPAHAASKTKAGLQGWVEVQWYDGYITIDGRGSRPDRGLWVTDTKVGDRIKDVSIIFYFADTDAVAWESLTGNGNAWTALEDLGVSTPSDIGVPVRGFRITYRRSITAASPITELNNNIVRRTTSKAIAGSRVWARRSVTVNDKVISFLRGPIAPGANSRQSRSAAPENAELVQGASAL